MDQSATKGPSASGTHAGPESLHGVSIAPPATGSTGEVIDEVPRIREPEDCTFLREDWRILSRHWFAVARAQDVRGRPLAARLLDVPLVIYRTPEGVRVAEDRCSHRGSPLSMGWVEGGEIVCPYHGLRFDGSGRCTRIPAQADVVPGPRFNIRVLPAVEKYGLVWTTLNGGFPDTTPPFPEWVRGEFFSVTNPPVDIRTSAGRQVEGFLDVAHFAWIHHTSFADRENQRVPNYKMRFTDFGMRSEYVSTVGNVVRDQRGSIPPDFLWKRVFDLHPPFTAILTVDFPDGGILRILNAATPVSARETRLFVPVTRNFATDGTVEDVYVFNAQIFAEDQAVVEAQRPKDLPLDLDLEAHFGADRVSIGYRRLLRRMGLRLVQNRST